MNDTFTYFQKKGCTVFSFPGKTRVLSTSPLNGGITAHLTHALNINCMNGAYECEMLGNTYEEDLNIHTKELGIDPQTATALSTAAWTELCAVEKICYQELSVTAAVTGGIDSNGMCPGDPSSYYERNGAYEMLPPGTINVFIYINQNVTEAAMVRSMMIASEAKAAAVSHLLLGSCYSEEIATGSGTDGMVIASAMEGELTLTDASGHSKLGELIGRAVRMAVKHADETDSCLWSETVSGSCSYWQIWNHPGNVCGIFIQSMRFFFMHTILVLRKLLSWKEYFYRETETAIWFYVCLFIFI